MEESRSITLTAASNEQTTAVQSSRKRMCCEELPYGCSTTTPQRSPIDIKSRNSPSSPQSIDQTRLQCSFTQKCTMTFSRKYHLTRHITRYHSRKYVDESTKSLFPHLFFSQPKQMELYSPVAIVVRIPRFRHNSKSSSIIRPAIRIRTIFITFVCFQTVRRNIAKRST